jgi:hypothetical protein
MALILSWQNEIINKKIDKESHFKNKVIKEIIKNNGVQL